MNKLGGETSRALDIAATPAQVDPDVAAFRPSKLLQGLPEGRDARLSIRIALVGVHQSRDATHQRAASGHVAAALPMTVMNSRRLISCLSPVSHSLLINVAESKLCRVANWQRKASGQSSPSVQGVSRRGK